jgi:hypothetical protein
MVAKYEKIHEQTKPNKHRFLTDAIERLILSGGRVTTVLVGGPWIQCKFRLHWQINLVLVECTDSINWWYYAEAAEKLVVLCWGSWTLVLPHRLIRSSLSVLIVLIGGTVLMQLNSGLANRLIQSLLSVLTVLIVVLCWCSWTLVWLTD